MKKVLPFFVFFCLLACVGPDPKPLTLHYDRPAASFVEALPLGNGRLGAMVYGGTRTDSLSLNDITLWTGEPDRGAAHYDYTHIRHIKSLTPWGQAAAWIPRLREALEREDYKLADSLQRYVQGHYSETYQPLGCLKISYPSGRIREYRRELDLHTATARVEYLRDGKPFSAQYMVSAPDSALVIHLKGEAPIEAVIGLEGQLPHRTWTQPERLVSDGYAAFHAYPDYYKTHRHFLYNPRRGIHYRTVVSCPQAVPEGDSLLRISGVKEALIVVSNQTSFNGFDKDPVLEGREYRESALRQARSATEQGWEQLYARHQADYTPFFDRLSLDLGTTPDAVRRLPTNRQLRRYAKGEENPELEALYFQYGRYLLIASSRTPGVPANLQGLWNERMTPPWSCNYTTNINLEENYWAAETAALPEMHQPLLEFIRNLSVNGHLSAQNFYGVEEGWCEAQNSDIWAMTCPVGLGVGDPDWANWNMGGAWLSTHLWEHWLFSRKREELERDYPALKGAAQFCLGSLLERDGEWITSPGTSPENYFLTPAGDTCATSYGCTADLALIRECLTDAREAALLLEDTAFVRQIDTLLPKLRPYQIGKEGNLQEWYHDWQDWDPRHRHQSHLVGLYPGHQIQAGTALADAAHKTLEIRGFKTTGWSCGWRVNLYARLGDGESAYKMFRTLLRRSTYPNLLDAHPPFQIDGNFGGCAGVLEMLVQSTPDSLKLLPALPAAWPSGELRGVRTRMGKKVDLRWENGKVTAWNAYD